MGWKIARTRNVKFRQFGVFIDCDSVAIKKLFKTKTLVLVFEVLFEETLRVSSKNCLKSKRSVSILKWFPAHMGWKIARTQNVSFASSGCFLNSPVGAIKKLKSFSAENRRHNYQTYSESRTY